MAHEPLTLLCLFPLPEEALERARQIAPGLTVHRLGRDDPRFAQRLAEADIIVGWPGLEDLPRARRLRWLQLGSAGADRYVESLLGHVTLTNASGVFGVPIAEHVLAMMLALVRRVPRMVLDAQRAHWNRAGDHEELFGATCGIVGLGDIGLEVARRAHAFGMRVVAVKRRAGEPKPAFVDELHGPEGLDAVLAAADHLVLALPGTPHTRHVLDATRIARLRPGARVYNVGRGSAIDQQALVAALQAGQLGGAGLDVFDPEPLEPDSPLWRMENVIVSPHRSGSTPRHAERLAEIFLRNLRHLLAGEPMENVVDREWGY